MKVKLLVIVEALDMVDQMNRVYYDKDTGEIGFVSEEISIDYDEDEQSIPDNTLFLPSSFEINEYSIMENFVYSLEEENIREEFQWAISGQGAFRNFKNLIHRYSIQEEWYMFKHKAYTEIAKEWCEENQLECS